MKTYVHRDRQNLLRNTQTDPQCTAFSSFSICLADPYSRPRGQQGRLLQLRTRRYFWSSYWQVAAYPEHRCSAAYLGEEVRAYSANALWATLAKSSVANPVPIMRSRVSMHSEHITTIPRRESSQDYRCHCPLPFEVGRHFVAARFVHPTSDPWRPRVSCGCTKSVEHAAHFCSNCCVFADFSAGTHDIVISIVIWLAYLHNVYPYVNCFWTPVVDVAVAQVRSIM